MEQITGRLVRDAEIKTTKGGTELVAFTLAVNDRYKPKGGEEKKETRYFNCAYFLSTKVQSALKQGCIVSIFGRINLNAYKGSDGEYHANLTCHVNHIDIIGSAKREGTTAPIGAAPAASTAAGAPETVDNLPF